MRAIGPHLIWRSRMRYLLILSTLIFSTHSSFATDESSDKKKLNAMVIRAAKENNIDLIKEYTKYGGNLDIKNDKGYTPLIFAAYYGHESMVNLLLESGANSCLKDNRGNTALMGAIFKGHLKISYTLLKSDCEVDTKNKSAQTALMYASLFGRKKIVKSLLQKGASSNLKDANGVSAIDLAKQQHNNQMSQLLSGSYD